MKIHEKAINTKNVLDIPTIQAGLNDFALCYNKFIDQLVNPGPGRFLFKGHKRTVEIFEFDEEHKLKPKQGIADIIFKAQFTNNESQMSTMETEQGIIDFNRYHLHIKLCFETKGRGKTVKIDQLATHSNAKNND